MTSPSIPPTTFLAPHCRVLIIDGHPAVGRGLKALVSEMPGCRVVGLATRGERGLAQAAEAAPDVALVDADLPGLCSEAIVRLLRARVPRARIVASGIYPERKWTLLQAGAHEFVLKDAGYEALRDAIAGNSGNLGGSADDGAPVVGLAEPLASSPRDGVVTAPAGPARLTQPAGSLGHEKRVLS